MKVVYNGCYGGFGLSHEAYMLYAKLKGVDVYPEDSGYGLKLYWTQPPNGDKKVDNKRSSIYANDLDRHDPVLVEVVERLGSKKASGQCAKLVVLDIDGNCYKIDEYDGSESVVTRDTDSGWISV